MSCFGDAAALDDRGSDDVKVPGVTRFHEARIVIPGILEPDGHRPRRLNPNPRRCAASTGRAPRKSRRECRRPNRGCACTAARVARPVAGKLGIHRYHEARDPVRIRNLILEILQGGREQSLRPTAKPARAQPGARRVFSLEASPARAVARLAPRSDSIGSTRVAIHAGAMPKTTPVTSEVSKANSSTGMEGDALMGTLADPGTRGTRNAESGACRQTRSRDPPTPPNRESKMLSMRGCLTTREARAPRAMLKEVCRAAPCRERA